MAFDVLLRGTNGATQGAFPGTSIRTEHTDKIEIISFEYELLAPKDPQRGPHATGRRQHKPIRICKNLDCTTPLFFNACTTNEFITTMTFEFWETSEQGMPQIYHEITIENAAVASIKYTTGFEGTGNLSTSRGHSQWDLKELEYIDLVFETIKLDHLVGTPTSAQDSWKN
ncbi:MAG: type VI secretion system tube protein Hcp [Polyangiaceae bacterium]|nr:type VI secretion system tube protein Hcp [Polyangiaceae bacterium]